MSGVEESVCVYISTVDVDTEGTPEGSVNPLQDDAGGPSVVREAGSTSCWCFSLLYQCFFLWYQIYYLNTEETQYIKRKHAAVIRQSIRGAYFRGRLPVLFLVR